MTDKIEVRVSPPEVVEIQTAPAKVEVVQLPAEVVETAVPGPRGPAGPEGPQGPSGDTDSVTVTGTAAETLGGHRAVVRTPSGFIYADCENLAHASAPIYMTLHAAVSGEPVQVQLVGEVTEPSWAWVSGQHVFLGTNGFLVSVPLETRVFTQVMGSAIDSTTLKFYPGVPILRAI